MKNLNKKTINIDRNIINIAFDRANGRFIAYNTITNIFAIGVCVETACQAYREKLLESKEDFDAADRQYEYRKSMGR